MANKLHFMGLIRGTVVPSEDGREPLSSPDLASNLTEALECISGEGLITGYSGSEVDEYNASTTVGTSDNTVAFAMVDALRSMGYGVTIFSPAEVEGIDREKLEKHLVQMGNDWIDLTKEAGDGQDS